MAARKTKRRREGPAENRVARQVAVSAPTTLFKWLPWLCVLAFLPAMFHNMQGWIAVLRYPGDANFGEGVLLYEGWRFAQGKSIYLDPVQPPFWMATYPPLYQLLIAIGGAHSLLWPRLITLAASFVCAGSLTLILKRMGQAWPVALLAPLLWFNSLFINIWSVLARVDMTGRALSSAAIAAALCIKRWRLASGFSLVCCLLAMLTKQNMIAGALTCTFIFGYQSWKRGALFFFSWAGLVVLAYLLFNSLTHGWFWNDIFHLTSRSFSPAIMWGWTSAFLETHALYLVAAASGIVVLVMAKQKEGLWIAAAVTAALPNIILSGNDGADRNYFFDLIWPLCAVASIGAGSIAAEIGRPFVTCICNGIAMCALLTAAVLVIRMPTEYPAVAQTKVAHQIVSQLQATRGPVLSELTAFPMLAGCEVEYLPYMLRKLEEGERWNPGPVIQQIQTKHYTAILLTNKVSGRFSPSLLRTLEDNYDVAAEYPNQFLVEGGGTFLLLRPRQQ